MILDAFPDPQDFYKNYWGKKPFIVRNYVPTDVIDGLIDGDTLAGLALEDDIKSRIITNNSAGDEWGCEHGPFQDDRFDDTGDADWSLLVQNVEQYHTGTANLLPFFQFSPRWLMDDVMVSFSAPGGSVGPHTDSYHTFLVQGMGKRAWTISSTQIDDDCYVDHTDMKVLRNGFEGETFEVTAGDVIYMPPFWGHEGKTIEAAMTFSVGFLGPKLSEILSEYAQYLEAHEQHNKRFLGKRLDIDSAAFSIGKNIQNILKSDLISSLESDHFSIWLASYFSTPTHEEIEVIGAPEDIDILATLKDGAVFIRPENVKLTILPSGKGDFYLAVFGECIEISSDQAFMIQKLNDGDEIMLADLGEGKMCSNALIALSFLYEQGALYFKD